MTNYNSENLGTVLQLTAQCIPWAPLILDHYKAERSTHVLSLNGDNWICKLWDGR